MPLALTLAWRYLTHNHDNASITTMIRICFAGIAIGSCALMLTLIITHGFEQAISEKIRGINAPLTIASPGNRLDLAGISAILRQEFGPQLAGISGHSTKQLIIDHDDRQTVVIARGINPVDEANVTTLPQKIVAPSTPAGLTQHAHFAQLLAQNSIIVGYKIAQELGLRTGDQISVMVPTPRSQHRLKLTPHTVTVSGRFNVGLEEYDSNMVLLSLETLNNLYQEEGVDQIALALTQHDDAFQRTVQQQLTQRFPQLSIRSWQEQYPALVDSLKLEKYVMFLIIALITLVACMNMLSLIFMQIQHKQRDIALFTTLGMPARTIRSIFASMGLMITVSASLTGLGIAALIGYILEHHVHIKIPDVYYIAYVPARLDTSIFLIVFLTTLILGLIATLLPLRGLERLRVVRILRNN